MRTFQKRLLCLLALPLVTSVHAAATADEAKALGTKLTPIGAEMAANADGTIPAYTGGLTTPPADFKAGSGIRPDPFAGEKPRVVIDAKNMSKYEGQLTEGAKALLTATPPGRFS